MAKQSYGAKTKLIENGLRFTTFMMHNKNKYFMMVMVAVMVMAVLAVVMVVVAEQLSSAQQYNDEWRHK